MGYKPSSDPGFYAQTSYFRGTLLGSTLKGCREIPEKWVEKNGDLHYCPPDIKVTYYTLSLEDIGNLKRIPKVVRKMAILRGLPKSLVCTSTLKEAKKVSKEMGLTQTDIEKIGDYYYPANMTAGHLRFLKWDGVLTKAIPW